MDVPPWVVDRYFLGMFCFMLGWILGHMRGFRERKRDD